jgi:hypothetical protein
MNSAVDVSFGNTFRRGSGALDLGEPFPLGASPQSERRLQLLLSRVVESINASKNI